MLLVALLKAAKFSVFCEDYQILDFSLILKTIVWKNLIKIVKIIALTNLLKLLAALHKK